MGLFKNLSDRQILKALTAKLGVQPREVKYDDRGHLIRLDLSDLGLTRLPPEIGQLSNLKELEVGGNQLTELPDWIGQLSNLKELEVGGNQLTELPDWIGQLRNLKELWVYNNQLTELPASIGRLTKLEILSVSSNPLTELPDWIGQLRNLKELWVYNNQLTELPDWIGQLSNLTWLYVSSNQLTELPATIGQLSNLTWLDVSSNQLTELPATIGQLRNLKELRVYKNQLTELPATIGQLSNLTWLDVSSNQLTELPATIGQLSNLWKLDVAGNQLTELPATIGQLSNLWKLDVAGNQLTELPDWIGQLSNLWKLDVAGNQLTELPDWIGQLRNLKELWVYNNQLTELPASIGRLTKLEILSVSSNPLTELPATIGQLSKLEELDVTGNQLTELPATIGQLRNLKELWVYNNQLTELPASIGRLTKLEILSVSSNQLTELPATIGQLSKLEELDVTGNQLTELPATIGQLSNLWKLDVAGNQLTELPATIGQLSNLTWLDVSSNQLTELPDWIGQLSNLTWLDVSSNPLTELPDWIGQLSNLTWLDVAGNQLTELPATIGQLSNLEWLYVRNNQLTELPDWIGQLRNLKELRVYKNQLTELPATIGQLSNLTWLDVSSNQLTELPATIGQLSNLEWLNVSNNQLTELPDWIGQLSNLKKLNLNGNPLQTPPREIVEQGTQAVLAYLRKSKKGSEGVQTDRPILEALTAKLGVQPREVKYDDQGHLILLDLSRLKLTQLPPEISQLKNLEALYLAFNQLTELPPEIGKLTKLKEFWVYNNQLTQLPPEIGQLSKLEALGLNGNPLQTPPREIVQQGTKAILAYLRGLQQATEVMHYEAKLLLLGDGRRGKTSLLRALLGRPFAGDLDSTHGIEIAPLELPHPEPPPQDPQAVIRFNVWDFGGQQIYQGAHQFFLTDRSLYLVVWNGGMDEEAQVAKWLRNIQTLVPQAPVLLVATHIDQLGGRPPQLNFPRLRADYPQLRDQGFYPVSSKTGEGLDALKAAIARTALELPLMQEPWPRSWLAVAEDLTQRPEHHISEGEYRVLCRQHGVEEADIPVLGRFLRDLGKILYFPDDKDLCDLVVLRPNWISKAISLIFKDPAVIESGGILDHADLPRIWAEDDAGRPYPPRLYPTFLRLMEQFDLSVQIPPAEGETRATHSLIPSLLPPHPPAALPSPPDWQDQDIPFIEMHYVFKDKLIPPDLIGRFITRTYRFTLGKHWREGVALSMAGDHCALTTLDRSERLLRLIAWGPQPQNLFELLRETLNAILSDFSDLKVEHWIPCTCGQITGEGCEKKYRYETLQRHLQKGRYEITCDESLEEVNIPKLLTGHPAQGTGPTQLTTIWEQQFMALKGGQGESIQEVTDLVKDLCQYMELMNRKFARQWNLERAKLDADCPNTFLLFPQQGHRFNPRDWFTQEYRLHLLCQEPSNPHLLPGDAGYRLRKPWDWWEKMGPWLGSLLTFLQYTAPVGGAAAGLGRDAVEQMKDGIRLMEKIHNQINPSRLQGDAVDSHQGGQALEGPALRVLYSLLHELDPAHHWAGLHKTLTPDGNILWLCDTHRKLYRPEPLVL